MCLFVCSFLKLGQIFKRGEVGFSEICFCSGWHTRYFSGWDRSTKQSAEWRHSGGSNPPPRPVEGIPTYLPIFNLDSKTEFFRQRLMEVCLFRLCGQTPTARAPVSQRSREKARDKWCRRRETMYPSLMSLLKTSAATRMNLSKNFRIPALHTQVPCWSCNCSSNKSVFKAVFWLV